MPKALHDKLAKQAAAQGLKGDRKDAYVYGTMRKTGWEPEREQKRKSRATVKALRNR
jgi:hypothetical protein